MVIAKVANWLQASNELSNGAYACVQDEAGVMKGLKSRVYVSTESAPQVIEKISSLYPVLGIKQEGELTNMVGFNVFLTTQEILDALRHHIVSLAPAFAEVA